MNLRRLIPFFDTTAQDWAIEARVLRWLTFVWLFIGLAMVFSASYAIADADHGDGLYYFKLQIFWVLVGLVGFNLLVHSPLRFILGFADWILLIILGLILVTLIPGVGILVNGSSRWLYLGPIPLQPSELIKPFLVLQSARIFAQWERLRWRVRLTWLGVFCLVVAGILLQPNLSTAALCGIMLWLIALGAGLPYQQLGGTALAGLTIAALSISLRSYQLKRILSFLNAWADPHGHGYQLIQSLLAVASGGWFGTGFGLSQQKLFYLPIQYTDFIFAVFAEEFGFVGSLLLLVLLVSYATLALRVALKARTPVQRLVAIGIMVLLIGQSLLNIGVATGVLPTTGLPFPFMSYGGSSMISSLISAGLLIRVARETSEGNVVQLDERRHARNSQPQPLPPNGQRSRDRLRPFPRRAT
ncbi:MAG: FtsW/RodA/SpoVE family cell cycle protein [Leptolyngbyaceae cyanobacterium bins.349]|nr:FtsW/RodA/SpoVE family cell cycle protein [Leptolyngbyaceae cyanobacterium bins.349]